MTLPTCSAHEADASPGGPQLHCPGQQVQRETQGTSGEDCERNVSDYVGSLLTCVHMLTIICSARECFVLQCTECSVR